MPIGRHRNGHLSCPRRCPYGPEPVSTVQVVRPPVHLIAQLQPLAVAAQAQPLAVAAQTQPLAVAAQTQPLAAPSPTDILGWAQRILVPPSAGAPLPTPQFPPVIAPTSTGTSIKAIYNAVEPWVQWGFELAAYAVGWVPYVGWLSPQITIFYHFGERIVRSIVFNFADWLDGNITFG
jgi:hypothetical protein